MPPEDPHFWRRPFGAIPSDDGAVDFRVWAPNSSALAVRARGRDHALADRGAGVFEGRVTAAPGDDYLYVLDDGRVLPDPCSRLQPGGIRGPSRVVERSFEVAAGPTLPLEEFVIYELHVGTFTGEGTFDAIIPHLSGLRELGVTAIELMPIATFPGSRGWGYDGVYAYAPHPAYGGPAGFARLVDAAHREQLGVILDVVYNHIGPGADAIAAFGPYFTDRYETPWGEAIDYSQPAAREWAIQNACMWVRDYKVDGLRLDAIHALFDESRPHVLRELRDRVGGLIVSETAIGDERPSAEWGHDARWGDSFHHALHVLLTGERDGYYERYGRVAQLAEAFEQPTPERIVIYAQNHDQVGNRALGDRLPPELLQIASACVLFAPHIPLLFMGEEYGERNPFQFFTDHVEPAIAEATREGRRKEFAGFRAFSGGLPDPQDPETCRRSKLSRRGTLRPHYDELLRLRRSLPRQIETEVDEEARVLRVRRGGAQLVVDFAELTWEIRR